MDLHCSPRTNTLVHGLGVTGLGRNPLAAIFDALVKLIADIPDVKAALIRDAAAAECPDDCKRKTVGKPEFKGLRADMGFDAVKFEWHCTIGVSGEIEILCESPVEAKPGGRPEVQP